jgi:hypothetical protein
LQRASAERFSALVFGVVVTERVFKPSFFLAQYA